MGRVSDAQGCGGGGLRVDRSTLMRPVRTHALRARGVKGRGRVAMNRQADFRCGGLARHTLRDASIALPANCEGRVTF